MFTISIVSHGQMSLVKSLLYDLIAYSDKYRFSVILTLNIPEELDLDLPSFPYPICVIKNTEPLGFGANHNQAFKMSNCELFCILNPDIRLPTDPFGRLLYFIDQNPNSIAAPLVVSKSLNLEDSARKYPTISILLKKLLFKRNCTPDYPISDTEVSVDWLAGMFLMLRSDSFNRLNGFDEKYFMYYEDVDLCFRNHISSYENFLITDVYVVHEAQRQSRRSLKHMKWHLSSCILFMITKMYRNLGLI